MTASARFEVSLPVAGEELAARVFQPVGAGPWPGIVLCAEATGVNSFIRGVGDLLASEGFTAIVPDYYRGAGPADPEDYSDVPALKEHINRLDFRRSTYDMLAAVDYLRTQPSVHAEHVFTWGYCTGATLAMLAGCLDRTLAGTVLFYPSQPVFESLNDLRPAHPRDLVWNHRAPMLLLYGDQDAAVPNAVQDDLRAELRRWNVPATTRVYAGAGHGFAGQPSGSAYRAEADRDSWALALSFARRHSATHDAVTGPSQPGCQG